MPLISAWLALTVAAPLATARLAVSAAQVSALILMVAVFLPSVPVCTFSIEPMVAPVLSFTAMPVVTLTSAPEEEALGVLDAGSSAGGVADELAGGAVEDVEAGGAASVEGGVAGSAFGVWARAGAPAR